jgi:dimethylhistidine N-methyltransferase
MKAVHSDRARGAVVLHDLQPSTGTLRSEVVAGLGRTPRTLPCKFLYDERGAELFEEICRLDAYYQTRTETGILRDNIADIAAALGPGLRLVEPGSGSGEKTRLLLANLEDLVAYIPVDISRTQLVEYAIGVAAAHSDLEVLPVCADYTRPLALPAPARAPRRTAVFFPGSTIGNFEPAEAQSFLQRLGALCQSGGAILIGVDLKKDRARLERAYDDPQGVTAAFNLNLLARVNAECGADFELDAFAHRAVYDEQRGRIEMHLVSRREQTVRFPPVNGDAGRSVSFHTGEFIDTEHSYKYSVPEFATLARRAGLNTERVWTDAAGLFSVFLLRVPVRVNGGSWAAPRLARP